MKRLYLIGKSDDNTKLYFARSKNAKSGSLELRVTPEVLRLIRAVADPEEGVPGRRARGGRKAEGRRKAAGLPPGGFERATGLGTDLEGVRAVIRRVEEAPPGGDAIALVLEGVEPVRGLTEEGAETPEHASREEEAERRRARVDSKMSPAEIQQLLRAGRGVRSVARQAQAPLGWVQRLALPIQDERVGVVMRLLRSYVVRARLGRSALPVGAAIIENLRDRGLQFPDRVVEEGWSASRPDGRRWRVQFTYESRGRTRRAEWDFDPQEREVLPRNDLAADIGFRSLTDADGVSSSVAEWEAAAIRPRTTGAARSLSGGGAKRGGRAAPARSSSKRAASRRGSSTRAARKPTKTAGKRSGPRRSARSGRSRG